LPRLAALLQLLAHVAQADAVMLDAELLVQHLALRTRALTGMKHTFEAFGCNGIKQ
jgi:hypothetical protein